ncbi:MAG: hypothetical protein U0270_08765 [Labilithrix sp.]
MRIHHSALIGLLAGFGALSWACSSDDNGSSSTTPTEPRATADASGNTVLPDGTVVAPDGSVIGKVTEDGGFVPAPEDGGTGDAGPSGPLPVPYTDFDVNHILMTGQSNSVSNNGTPVLTKAQPYGNLMFNTGVMPGRGSRQGPDAISCGGDGCVKYDTPSSLVPLVEGDQFFNYAVETSASSIANQISFLAQGSLKDQVPGLPNKHDLLMSLHGRSGNTYWCLRKGGCNYMTGLNHPFDQGMQEVQSGLYLAKAQGKSYVVRAVVAIHGESDHYSYTAGNQEFPNSGSDGTPGEIQNYADGLLEWQSDYETGVKEITRQSQPVPMFISQISGWNDAKTSKVAQFQLDAHVRAPGKVILVGPAYALELGQVDCLHYTNVGEQHLGEMFGKVYAKVVLEGRTWEPVRPQTVTRNGAELTVRFHVPEPPLVFDTSIVAATKDMGFEYLDGAGNVQAITKVELTGADTVKITLASDAGPGHLTYAQNQTPSTCIGTPSGARGNLRDSDKTPSQHGFPLYNWSVHFDVEVP